jgi:hypothetical protein
VSALRRIALAALSAFVLVVFAPGWALAADALTDPVDQWLPSSDDATWTYSWSNDRYAPTPTLEQYKLSERKGSEFALSWTTQDLGNGDGTVQSSGVIGFDRTETGLANTGWNSTPPPPQFPILCGSASGCGNSLSSALFLAVWGSRGPVLQEPLVRGARWSSLGGANNDVSSGNRYVGTEQIDVPAFPGGVSAARVESDVTQAGALGDPYGTGVRTVWWVRGVGPVRMLFRHAGGETSQAELVGTNLDPRDPPSDLDYLPFEKGRTAVYRYRNSRHLKQPSTQTFKVADAVNNSARVEVQVKSGPIRAVGAYVFATRLDGVKNTSTSTKAASLVHFPDLGPRTLSKARRRRFFTAYDLMTFGFNPVLPAYPRKGDSWKSSTRSRDFKVFGVVGSSKVLGVQRVRTPKGTFNAMAVRSRLRQKGFPFGSGTRTSWFAPGEGLVKLVFAHGDGSVSTVERVR